MMLEGKIRSGQGDASFNYPSLLPKLCQWMPEVRSYHPASLNVLLDRPLDKERADVWTPRIEWKPQRKEAFGFTAIEIDFPPQQTRYKAVIFAPEGGFLTYDPFAAEVIVERFIDRIGEACRIYVEDKERRDAPADLGKIYQLRFQQAGDWVAILKGC